MGVILFQLLFCEAPTSIRSVERCPDPEEGPYSMQGKEAYPACRMDSVLMRVIAFVGYFIGDVMNNDDTIKTDQHHDEQNAEGELIEKHTVAPCRNRYAAPASIGYFA